MIFLEERILIIASIELIAAMLCILAIVSEHVRKVEQRKISNTLKIVLLMSSLCLTSDGISYLCNGNPRRGLLILNNIVLPIDFISFAFALYFLGRFFLKYKAKERSNFNKSVLLLMKIVTGANCILVALNPFLHWFYSVSAHNVYCKGDGIWFYAASLIVEALAIIIMAVVERNNYDHDYIVVINIGGWALSIGGLLEVMLEDFPGSNIGLAVAIISIYVIQKIQEKKLATSKNQSYTISFTILFLFTALCVFAAFLINIVSLVRVAKDNSENNSHLIAQMVGESIDNSFMRPMTVAQTMANSANLSKELSKEIKGTSVSENEEIVQYLASIRDGMDYQVAFAVSEKSHQYYTNEGVAKIIDPENDAHDVWYSIFVDKNKEIDLDVDTDENNNGQLSVFVNTRVEDANGEFLGVCGVGMTMENLQSLLISYEKMYNIDIALIDPDGLIQVDSDGANIEVNYLDNSYLENAKMGGFYYELFDDHSRMTKYMEDLDWYVVINDYNPDKIGVWRIVFPGIMAALCGLILIVGSFFGIHIHEEKLGELIVYKNKREEYLLQISEMDELTGVKNRNAFEEYQKTIGKMVLKDTSIHIVMLDINGLKTVNDTLGHTAGDELIVGAVKCIKATLGKVGEIYRIGGDEFVVISFEADDVIKQQMNNLHEHLLNWNGALVKELSASIGMASSSDEPDMDFDALFKLADDRMYADKNEYYRKTGKDRRMSW